MGLRKDVSDWLALRGRIEGAWSLIRGRRRAMPAPTCEIRLRAGGSLTLRTDTDDRRVFLQIFGRDEYRLARLEKRGLGTVVDIGAHAGIFAARVAPFARRVVSFEPSPATLLLLRANVAGLPNVTVVPKAVTDRRGSGVIHVLPEPSGNTLYPARPEPDATRVTVDCLSLADAFAAYGVDRCDLLKLDCEGAEYPIVLGAPADIWSRVERVAMEFHRVEGAPPDWCADGIAARLSACGHDVDVERRRHHAGKGLIFSRRK
jgi:FkbM family methyltransferase